MGRTITRSAGSQQGVEASYHLRNCGGARLCHTLGTLRGDLARHRNIAQSVTDRTLHIGKGGLRGGTQTLAAMTRATRVQVKLRCLEARLWSWRKYDRQW